MRKILCSILAIITIFSCSSFVLASSNASPSTRTFFIDVPDQAWYYEPVTKIQKYGLVEGVGGGRFLPLGNVTKAEAMLVMDKESSSNFAKKDSSFFVM